MSNRYSLATLLPIMTFAALGFWFAQGASAGFPFSTADPGTPPSTSPNHSGGLNNFGSNWVFAFSSIVPADVTIDWAPPNTAIIRGTAVGGEVSGGSFVPSRTAVWDVNITVTGVVRTLDPVFVPTPVTTAVQQTVTYTGVLTAGAIVAGTYTLNVAKTLVRFGALPTPIPADSNQFPDTWFINVGANAALPTLNLKVDPDPDPTFPAALALGVNLAVDQVFSFTETRFYEPGVP